MTDELGIPSAQCINIAKALTPLLADTYALYLKTQNYHWNVQGMNFYSLHLLFERQYKELAEAVDRIAERIRTLGTYAPGGFKAYLEYASIKENDGNKDAITMLKQLMQDHSTLIRSIRKVFSEIEKNDDYVTIDLLTERLEHHESTIWMLRSQANV